MRYRLADIFELQMGKTPSRNNPKYWGTTDNKWISISDLSQAGKYIYDTKEYLSDEAVKDSGIKIIPANTVIMSFKLSIGKTAIVSENMYSNEAIMAFHDKHVVEMIPEYIYYMFKYRDWEAGTNKAVMGKTLNKATLSLVEVDICDIEKQREIVEILDKVDAVIDGRTKELQKLDDLTKARFVEMFGDPVKHLDNGDTVQLETLAEKITVGFVGEASNEYVEKGIPYLRTQNVRVNRIDLNGLIYVNERFHRNNPKSTIHPRDVVISRVGVNRGMAAMVPETLPEANIANCLIVGQTEKIEPYYLAFYMNMSFGKRPQFGASVGSAQGVVNTSTLKKWEIFVPDKNLQTEFYEFAKQVNKSKVAVQKALDKRIFWVNEKTIKMKANFNRRLL
jgi:type I restriction enzyme S subunit